jgi:hypothetical protein
MALDRPVAWDELFAGIWSACDELLKVRPRPRVTAREWVEGRVFPVEAELLTFNAPMTIVMFSLGESFRAKRCAELHLYAEDEGAGKLEVDLPDQAEVSATERWPESVAMMAAVALGLARLTNATITYAPWSSGVRTDRSRGEDPGSWSAADFALAVRLSEPQSDLQSACSGVARNLFALIGK